MVGIMDFVEILFLAHQGLSMPILEQSPRRLFKGGIVPSRLKGVGACTAGVQAVAPAKMLYLQAPQMPPEHGHRRRKRAGQAID